MEAKSLTRAMRARPKMKNATIAQMKNRFAFSVSILSFCLRMLPTSVPRAMDVNPRYMGIPRGWARNEVMNSPWINAVQEVVSPHPGHGRLNIRTLGQGGRPSCW